MKIKIVVAAVIVILLAVVTWVVVGRGSGQTTRLVQAWQLTADRSYDSNALVDPVVSWSPDSKSLLFVGIGAKFYQNYIYQWKVGDTRIIRLSAGFCPNYVANDRFLYLKSNPRVVAEYDLTTRRERFIAPQLAKWDLWRELTGFSYDPMRKTLALRFAKFSRYYEPGVEEADLNGKYLGRLPRTTGGGVLDRSRDPRGNRDAVILGDLTGETRQLRIARPGDEFKATTIVENDLGAVAWSPDGKTVAFAEADEVKLLNPANRRIVTIARFTNPSEDRYVCRLVWSPNSKYLAAVELVPTEESAFMMIYVLNLGSREARNLFR